MVSGRVRGLPRLEWVGGQIGRRQSGPRESFAMGDEPLPPSLGDVMPPALDSSLQSLPPYLTEDEGMAKAAAKAAGGALVGATRVGLEFGGGLAAGMGGDIYEQLPSAGDVGSMLGRGAVAGAT